MKVNAQTKITPEVEGGRSERPTLRDLTQELNLAAIDAEGTIKGLLWSMEGLCKAAEGRGLDVSYWRAKIAEVGVRYE